MILMLVFCVMKLKHKRNKEMKSMVALRTLSKMPFSSIGFEADKECIICWNSYNDTDQVTQLKCDQRHFFHTSCIEDWIKSGNSTCPLCRKTIGQESIEMA